MTGVTPSHSVIERGFLSWVFLSHVSSPNRAREVGARLLPGVGYMLNEGNWVCI